MKKHLLIIIIAVAAVFLLPEMLQAQKTVTTVTSKEKKEAEVLAREKAEQEKLLQERQLDQVRIQIDSLRGRRFIGQVPVGDIKVDVYSHQGSLQGFQSRGMPRTSWDFSRSLNDNSSVKEYVFEVEKDMKNLSMSISGMSRSGEIRISILMPGNKSYSEVVIDEFGNLNWRKSFELNEDSKDKIGVWKFKVSTKKASGNFRISLSAT